MDRNHRFVPAVAKTKNLKLLSRSFTCLVLKLTILVLELPSNVVSISFSTLVLVALIVLGQLLYAWGKQWYTQAS
jgi:hypothetical protein